MTNSLSRSVSSACHAEAFSVGGSAENAVGPLADYGGGALLRQFSTIVTVESGFPGFVSTSWTGLLAPAHTPQPVIAKLNAAINEGLKTPELKTALERLSNEPLGGTPADFTTVIKADLDKWSPIVNSLGLNKP